MTATTPPVLRGLLLLVAVALIGAALTLGYVAAIALRRSEGVFMPAGYVAVICLVAGVWLLRTAMRD